MYKSKGYEIAFKINIDDDKEEVALKILKLTLLKSSKQSILDITISDLDNLVAVIMTEEAYNYIDFSWLGPMVFETELMFYNISMNDTLSHDVVQDIQKQNTHYFYTDNQMPYILAKNDIYEGIGNVSFS